MPDESAANSGDFGKRTSDLERDVRRFARRLRRSYAAVISQDARGFKRRVIALLRRQLPPFAGRPSEECITTAIELRKEGLEWKSVYPRVISGHGELDPAVRRQAESNLRAAIRSRRNAARRRKRRQRFPKVVLQC